MLFAAWSTTTVSLSALTKKTSSKVESTSTSNNIKVSTLNWKNWRLKLKGFRTWWKGAESECRKTLSSGLRWWSSTSRCKELEVHLLRQHSPWLRCPSPPWPSHSPPQPLKLKLSNRQTPKWPRTSLSSTRHVMPSTKKSKGELVLYNWEQATQSPDNQPRFALGNFLVHWTRAYFLTAKEILMGQSISNQSKS